MNLKKALLNNFSFPMLSNYFLMESFFLRIFDNILHPHDSLSKIGYIFDMFFDAALDDKLSGLIPIMF